MKDLSFAIPLPERTGLYSYKNIARIGQLKIEDPGVGITIMKNTVGSPMTYTTLVSFPANWEAGETIIINKPSGLITIDVYSEDALLEASDVPPPGVVTTMVDGLMLATDKVKLDGIATGATANIGDMTKAVYDTNNDGVVDFAASVPWTGITSKPTTFTPATHTHVIADVTGLQTALDAKQALLSRATATHTSSSLANLAQETSTITMAKSFQVLKLTTDRAARIRLYATAAVRDADTGRSILSTAPVGCILDVITTVSVLSLVIENCFGANMDGTPATTVYITTDNLSGSTSTVQTDLVYLGMEA